MLMNGKSCLNNLKAGTPKDIQHPIRWTKTADSGMRYEKEATSLMAPSLGMSATPLSKLKVVKPTEPDVPEIAKLTTL